MPSWHLSEPNRQNFVPKFKISAANNQTKIVCPANYPSGSTLTYSDGAMNYPSGSTFRYSDGSMNYPSGSTLRYKDGAMNYESGSTLRYSDGAMNYPSGSTLRYSRLICAISSKNMVAIELLVAPSAPAQSLFAKTPMRRSIKKTKNCSFMN